MLELTTKVIEEIIKLSEALETLTLKKIGALGIQLQSGQALDDIRNAVQLGKSTHDVFDDMGGFLSLKEANPEIEFVRQRLKDVVKVIEKEEGE